MRLVIRTPLPSLNDVLAQAKNQTAYRSPYAKAKREAELTIRMEIDQQLREYQKKFSYMEKWKVEVDSCLHFRWYEKNRRRDPDNIASGAKFVLDAMIKQGCLANDNWQYIRYISHDFIVDKDNPRLELHISSIPFVIQAAPSTMSELLHPPEYP